MVRLEQARDGPGVCAWYSAMATAEAFDKQLNNQAQHVWPC